MDDTQAKLRADDYALVLINRKLDCDYTDGIEIEDVTRFETEFLSQTRSKHGDVLTAIRDSGEITPKTDTKLKGILDGFVKTFA